MFPVVIDSVASNTTSIVDTKAFACMCSSLSADWVSPESHLYNIYWIGQMHLKKNIHLSLLNSRQYHVQHECVRETWPLEYAVSILLRYSFPLDLACDVGRLEIKEGGGGRQFYSPGCG